MAKDAQWLPRVCRTAAGTIMVATLLLIALLAQAPAAAAEIQLVVEDVRSEQGVLRLELLRIGDGSEDGVTTAQIMVPAVVPRVRVTLHDLGTGRYAARVHHDVDDDGAMATNLVGMPTEPWGVSNDARGRFGPPRMTDMAVDVGDEGGVLRMTLVH